jgi:adenylate cyclase
MLVLSELRRRNVFRVAIAYLAGSWLLIQLIETLFPIFGLGDELVRLFVVLLIVGFPLVLVFSWLYEITPDGIKLERDVNRSESVAHHTGKKLDRAIMIVLAISLGYFAFDKFVLDPARDNRIVKTAREEGRVEALLRSYGNKSVAVLPFADMSPDGDQEYFSDGITEELLNLLANVKDLRVISRTSVFSLKGKNLDIPTIASRLNVAHVLEGSVRKAGNRIRITAQLIDARSDTHLWSETYDRELGDIFAIQDEIASAITTALAVTVLGSESMQLTKNPTDNFGAYDYYLLGQYQRERRNPASLEKSIELFQQALERDDRFALGYAALASSYLFQAYYSDVSPEKVVELSQPLIAKALELDPNLLEAHVTRASVRLLVRDFKAADAGFRKAIELRPNYSGAWSNLGFSMVLQSRLKEALEAYERSEILDPLNANLQFNFGALKMLTGRYDEGVEAFRMVAEIAPERAGTAAAIAHWSNSYGHYAEAARWVRSSLTKSPDADRPRRILAEIYLNLAVWDKAWEALSDAVAISPNDVRVLGNIVNFHLQTGDDVAYKRFVESQYAKIDHSASSLYSPTDKARYQWHGIAALFEGNYVQAVNDLTKAAGGDNGIANAVYDDIWTLRYLAYSFQKQGNTDAANELLIQCLNLAMNAQAQGWNTPVIHYRTAEIYALLGDSDNAIAKLQQAVESGWRKAGGLERNPLFASLEEDQRFQTIKLQVAVKLENMRDEVTSILSDFHPDP